MIAHAEIRQMPFSEKLALLEAVWSELAIDADSVEVPQWHKDILDERERAVEQGTSKMIDWDAAKEQIQKMVK